MVRIHQAHALVLAVFYLSVLACSAVDLPAGPQDPVTVFELGEAGYYCMKIPYVLTTKSGVILAFAEARRPTCSDYTWTDLVVKRSMDNGNTWGPLHVVYSNSTSDQQFNVIGNAGPVQERTTGRIWLPFCQNNSQVLLSFSDDDGQTWAEPTDISSSVVMPDWKWVGIGPPAGLQLESGRLIMPCYHAPYHDLDGTFTHPHVMYSDDLGKTWGISMVWDYANDKDFSNENQAVELQPGTVMISARTIGTHRSAAFSHDNGTTFGSALPVANMPEPFDGVEGSIVKHNSSQWVFFSNPHEDDLFGLRYNMTLQVSKDYAKSWEVLRQIDVGPSGYSALTVSPTNDIGILYERSNETRIIFLPSTLSYQVAYEFP